MRSWLRELLAVVYPPTCYGCRADTEGGGFCRTCLDRIRPPGSPMCPICGVPFVSGGPHDHLCGTCLLRRPRFDRARACAVYDAHDDQSPLRRCLHLYKYQRRAELASPLAELLQRYSPYDLHAYDGLLPVPLHPERLRWRGFNQAILLVRPLALAAGQVVDPFSLVRVRATPPQVDLTEARRRDNVRHAFAVRDPSKIRGRRILLIDDVMTTGATVDECARVLKRAGARRVDVLVLARAVVQ